MIRRLLRDYSLSLVLAALFAASWAGQAVVQIAVVGDTAAEFWAATLENWQSEFLQVLAFVALTAVFVHRGSAESKDSDDEIKARLDAIERRLR